MKTKEEQLNEVLNQIDIDLSDLGLRTKEINDLTFDELTDLLFDNYLFDVEIIYYFEAMKYLSKNDPSLQESLGIASEFGYATENLNSELLASLHATKKKEEDYFNLQSEIEDILNS